MKKIVLDGGKGVAHYSAATLHNGVLYVSGQLSKDPETGKVPEGGIGAQTIQSLKNVERVLKAAGCTKEDVLQCRVYVPDISYWGEVNSAYAEFFGEHRPARVLIPIKELSDGVMVEIEAVAACEER